MSRILRESHTCRDCRQSMPAGTRVRGAGPFRHYDACPPIPATASHSATERQVQFALDLQASVWTPAVLGGRRYDRDELAALSKQEISRVIDALVSERDLQGA